MMKTRLTTLRLLYALILMLLFAGEAWGAPAVTGVTGTLSDGQSITISGSGFGATGPSIAVFDDFEGGVVGDGIHTDYGDDTSIAPVGAWTRKGTVNSNIFYGSAYKRSGAKSAEVQFLDEASQTIRVTSEFATGSHTVFGVWWLFMPAGTWPCNDCASGPGWKQVWVHNAGDHTGNDSIVFSMPCSCPSPQTCGGCYITGNNIQPSSHSPSHSLSLASQFTQGSWHRFVYYQKGSYESGTGTRRLDMIKGTNALVNVVNSTNEDNQKYPDQPYNLVEMGAGGGAGDLNGEPVYAYFDDFYFAYGDSAQARIEIGDNATYTSCTNLAICTPTSWADTSLAATVRMGSFTTGTAYLFVINADGTASSGYEITLGEEDTTPPTSSGVSGSGVSRQ